MNLLTLIIPFLNEGEEVRNTLQSIRETAGNGVDIILINDASADDWDYGAMAREFQAEYVVNRERKGVAWSRDYGVERCRTPYFLLLDAHMRFYQNDWADLITGELERDSRGLICCNTRILHKENGKVKEKAGSNSVFGAWIAFRRATDILGVKWRYSTPNEQGNIEKIPCVLGAAYAGSKSYWQYIRGLEGLENYGCDEQYISLKVSLEGGTCRLLKDLYVGHIYRETAPYEINTALVMYNKLWIAYTLLPPAWFARVVGVLSQHHATLFRQAYGKLMAHRKGLDELKEYYSRIFTVPFENVRQMNEPDLSAGMEYSRSVQKKTPEKISWMRFSERFCYIQQACRLPDYTMVKWEQLSFWHSVYR